MLRLQLLGAFGINKLLKSKIKGDRGKIVLYAFLGLILGIVFIAAIASNFLGFALTERTELIPGMAMLFATLITISVTYMKSNGLLFGQRDYDQTMSLPVTASQVILSRLTMVYLVNLVISLLTFVSAIGVYAFFVQISLINWIMLVVVTILTPIFPTILMIFIGTFTSAIGSRFRRKNLITTILSFVWMILTIGFISVVSVPGNDEAMLNIFPPANWLTNGVANGNWLLIMLYFLVSILLLVAYVSVAAKHYAKINTAWASQHKQGNYKIGEMKIESPFMALYKRELKRLASNSTYLMNSCFGAFMLLVAAPLMIIFSDTITGALIFEDIGFDIQIAQILPYIIALPICISTTTSVALSLEGRSRWIMCSLPIRASTVFNSKIAVGLTVMLPSAVIAGVCALIAFDVNALEGFFLILLPVAFAFFIVVGGMFANAKFPRYDWSSEYKLIKGGTASVMIVVFGGMTIATILFIVALSFTESIILINILVAVGLIVVTGLMYLYLRRVRLYE